MKKICVIGTGYVGLVGAAVFSKWKNVVVGVDVDQAKLDSIAAGVMPIFEAGLEELVGAGLKNGNLQFTSSLAKGIKDAEVIFICVGTPQGEAGDADVSAVLKVAEQIGQNLDHYAVVATKSTVPVGTNLRVKEIVQKNLKDPQMRFDVASCPEFLAQGTSVRDMENTGRTVIGGENPEAIDIVASIFEHLPAKIVRCTLAEAELIKYAANGLLATKISYADSIAAICERIGNADINIVMEAVGLDPRIGPHFLTAGIGWGGSCFPKDVKALAYLAEQLSLPLPLLQATLNTNRSVHKRLIHKIELYLGTNLNGRTLACLGTAFKAETDDTRESPGIKVIKRLRGAGAVIRSFDPEASGKAAMELGHTSITYCDDMYETMEGADGLVILTPWVAFKGLDLNRVKTLLKTPVIFDGRNLLNTSEVQSAGFMYFGMGRPTNGEDYIRKMDTTYSAKLNGSK